MSLPINATREIKGDVVKHYFDNLLPDNDRIRARLGSKDNADQEFFLRAQLAFTLPAATDGHAMRTR